MKNGKEDGTYYKASGLGLGFRRDGKENGNYYIGLYSDYHKDPWMERQ